MEQQSRKTNFLTLPDLAFGFVHKRSGNEITLSWHCFLVDPRLLGHICPFTCMYMINWSASSSPVGILKPTSVTFLSV